MSRLLPTDPSEIGPRFGATVRRLREQRRWSQERLALRAELNRSYMGEIERGLAMPSLATAAKLAEALEVSLAELIARCEPGSAWPAAAGRPAGAHAGAADRLSD